MLGIQGRDQTLGSELFGSKSEIRDGNPDSLPTEATVYSNSKTDQ